MSRRDHVSIACRVLALVAVLGLCFGAASQAGTTGNLQALHWVNYDQDKFDNYDFDSESVRSDNVDWPVTLVFFNDAEIDKVKHALSWKWFPPSIGFAFPGSREHGRLNDGFGWVWDTDGGRKTILCPGLGSTSTHYRIYADGDDRLYNLGNGYYVLGTTHRDHGECGGDQWFGYSEEAERIVAARSRKEWGSRRVYADAHYCFNYEPLRMEGNHIWSNNGYCTYIRVP